MLATQLRYNMKSVINDGSFSHSPKRQLTYKPMPVLHERNVATKMAKPLTDNTSMGFAIPFQPCMWDEKTVDTAWNNAMQMLQTKMKDKYSEECIDKMLVRFKKLFTRLNFNTRRKSLAVILTPGEEKLFYLSFPVKPVMFFRKSVSLLDLAANMKQEVDFYYLILDNGRIILHEYYNKQLRKVYETNNETNTGDLYKKVSHVIELLNGKNAKPVFVTGSPTLVEQFFNSEYYTEYYFPLLYHNAAFSSEFMPSIIKEITRHWSYWRSKFIVSRVLLAQKTNCLISNAEAVLQALRKSKDGLLLMDKHIKRQLQKSIRTNNVIFQKTEELLFQIEKFLVRGNRIEITETGLLKNIGGIVLLQDNKPAYTEHKPYHRQVRTGGSLYY